jgi:hypothetical protein
MPSMWRGSTRAPNFDVNPYHINGLNSYTWTNVWMQEMQFWIFKIEEDINGTYNNLIYNFLPFNMRMFNIMWHIFAPKCNFRKILPSIWTSVNKRYVFEHVLHHNDFATYNDKSIYVISIIVNISKEKRLHGCRLTKYVKKT